MLPGTAEFELRLASQEFVKETPTIQSLTPNLPRAFVRVFLCVLLVAGITAVCQRYLDGHWWGADYVASLGIPLVLAPASVCLLFVPRRIQWSAAEFQIQPRFRPAQSLPWSQLYAYGSANNVFLLQFTGVRTFQIFAGAYPRDEWRAFRAFLTANYPNKKAWFWLGPKAIRK